MDRILGSRFLSDAAVLVIALSITAAFLRTGGPLDLAGDLLLGGFSWTAAVTLIWIGRRARGVAPTERRHRQRY